MIEIFSGLFIGSQTDYEITVKHQENWAVVHACKEPYHRQALGYSGRACAKEHPEYLLAYRGDRLILNLVDVDNPAWISPIIINSTIEFIDKHLALGQKVLVHCNQGQSRSAGIGLLYLANKGEYRDCDFLEAESRYKEKYPFYNPAAGIRGFCMQNWQQYSCDK